MSAAKDVTFAPSGLGHYVMRLRDGDRSVVRPSTHRPRKNRIWCAKCRHLIDSGATIYREALSPRERRFLAGIAWCFACVTGGSQ